jgi:acetyl esterase
LEAGISVASINYRYISITPLPAAHYDAKRTLQFIRSKAGAWKINKERIATFGGSTGAQICMWFAFGDDMAAIDSNDPVERESTRLTCVVPVGRQTILPMNIMEDHSQSVKVANELTSDDNDYL